MLACKMSFKKLLRSSMITSMNNKKTIKGIAVKANTIKGNSKV